MNQELNFAFGRLETCGWQLVLNETKEPLPDIITNRYPWISSDVQEVMIELKSIIAPDDTFWILTANDYSERSESKFAWNEWEIQSIEAAQGDSNWIKQIRDFWDQHLPIAISVRDGYAYHALREDGTVVVGREPEFEEVSPFASSYLEFITLL